MSITNMITAYMDLAPEETLMKSRMDCHCKGVDSIVLAENKITGALTRMFISRPESDLCKGWNDNTESGVLTQTAVGVHDHKYPLRLQSLLGRVIHLECAVTRNMRDSVAMRAAMVGAFGEDVEVLDRERHVRVINKTTLRDVYLPPETLHTMISCPLGSAWLVTEGAQQKDKSICLTRQPFTSIDTSGMYRAFEDTQSVIRHVQESLMWIEQST